MGSLPPPSVLLAALTKQLGLPPFPKSLSIQLDVLLGWYSLLLLFLLLGMGFRCFLLFKQWKTSRLILLRRLVPITTQIGLACHCITSIAVIVAVYRRHPGPRLSHLNAQLMIYLPLNFTAWGLVSQAMHTLPTRRAVVELPTRPSRHRSRIERLMQTSPMRATVAFLIPSILVAIQLVYIQRAYTSQQRFRKVWDSLEPIVISAQSGGWTQETESQAGALLESFQVLAAEFIEKTRAVMAVFLVTCVLTFVTYLPFVITLESVLRVRITHLRHSLASSAEVAALRTFAPTVGGSIEVLPLESPPVLSKNRPLRFQRFGSAKTRPEDPSKLSATAAEFQSKLLSLEAVRRVMLFQAGSCLTSCLVLFILSVIGIGTPIIFQGPPSVQVLLTAYGFLIPMVPSALMFLIWPPVPQTASAEQDPGATVKNADALEWLPLESSKNSVTPDIEERVPPSPRARPSCPSTGDCDEKQDAVRGFGEWRDEGKPRVWIVARPANGNETRGKRPKGSKNSQ